MPDQKKTLRPDFLTLFGGGGKASTGGSKGVLRKGKGKTGGIRSKARKTISRLKNIARRAKSAATGGKSKTGGRK